MNCSGFPFLGCIAALGAFLFAACSEPTAPDVPELRPQYATTTGADLIECPTAEAKSATATIGALGGEVAVDGHRVLIPAGAVLFPTEITLTVPASRYLEVEIMANGVDSFTFESLAYVTVSYSRCQGDYFALGAWQIDPSTRTLLENMNALHQRLAERVTFFTDHLSLFALAD